MKTYFYYRRYIFLRKAMCSILVFTLIVSLAIPPSIAQVLPNLPAPGQGILLTPEFQPPILRGMIVHPENPLLFDFIVDRGQNKLADEPLKAESEKLIKHFLASMTIPDKDAWVNLSPYEKDRIIPDALGSTEMGRQMLEQDYILKQLASSLTNPKTELGQQYWNEVRRRAQIQFGTTDISYDTMNKVWIVPDGATVVEKDGFAYITESKLKVMLDEDYVALAHQKASAESQAPAWDVAMSVGAGLKPAPTQDGRDLESQASRLSSEVFRELILPKLIKEVNTGRNFAATRQVYQGVILAAWYKQALKESLLVKIYADQSKVEGVESDDKDIKQKVYQQYLEAFKKGVYNFIKEDQEANGEIIPRKYFSGGESLAKSAVDLTIKPASDAVLDEVASDTNQALVPTRFAESVDEAKMVQQGAAATGEKSAVSNMAHDLHIGSYFVRGSPERDTDEMTQWIIELVQNADSTMMQKFMIKYRDRIAELIPDEMVQKIDLITGIPPTIIREKGDINVFFTQALSAQFKLRTNKETPVRYLLKKTRETKKQSRLETFDERRANVRDAFVIQEDVRGKTILVVDDVNESGETFAEVRRILELAGATVITLAMGKSNLKFDQEIFSNQDGTLSAQSAASAGVLVIQDIKSEVVKTVGGDDTLRVEVKVVDQATGKIGIGFYTVPAGTSAGADERKPEQDMARLQDQVNLIGQEVKRAGLRPDQLAEIGQLMLKIDADMKTRGEFLGAQATLGYQMALAQAVANARDIELWPFLREVAPDLVPAVKDSVVSHEQNNVTNGGAHADNDLDMQEFMFVPVGKDVAESNQMDGELVTELGRIYQTFGLKVDLTDGGEGPMRGTEGGYKIEDLKMAKVQDILDNQDALKQNAIFRNFDFKKLAKAGTSPHEFVLIAMEAAVLNAGYKLDKSGDVGTVGFALDPATTEMAKDDNGQVTDLYDFEGSRRDARFMTDLYLRWVNDYPIRSIEDAFHENHWEAWINLMIELKGGTILIGDDLLVTQGERLMKLIELLKARSLLDENGKVRFPFGILIKVNQNGFLTTGYNDPTEGYMGAIEVMRLARKHGFILDISHRSKEAKAQYQEAAISDIAAAFGAEFVKLGTRDQPARQVKLDRLAEIDKGMRSRFSAKKKQDTANEQAAAAVKAEFPAASPGVNLSFIGGNSRVKTLEHILGTLGRFQEETPDILPQPLGDDVSEYRFIRGVGHVPFVLNADGIRFFKELLGLNDLEADAKLLVFESQDQGDAELFSKAGLKIMPFALLLRNPETQKFSLLDFSSYFLKDFIEHHMAFHSDEYARSFINKGQVEQLRLYIDETRWVLAGTTADPRNTIQSLSIYRQKDNTIEEKDMESLGIYHIRSPESVDFQRALLKNANVFRGQKVGIIGSGTFIDGNISLLNGAQDVQANDISFVYSVLSQWNYQFARLTNANPVAVRPAIIQYAKNGGLETLAEDRTVYVFNAPRIVDPASLEKEQRVFDTKMAADSIFISREVFLRIFSDLDRRLTANPNARAIIRIMALENDGLVPFETLQTAGIEDLKFEWTYPTAHDIDVKKMMLIARVFLEQHGYEVVPAKDKFTPIFLLQKKQSPAAAVNQAKGSLLKLLNELSAEGLIEFSSFIPRLEAVRDLIGFKKLYTEFSEQYFTGIDAEAFKAVDTDGQVLQTVLNGPTGEKYYIEKIKLASGKEGLFLRSNYPTSPRNGYILNGAFELAFHNKGINIRQQLIEAGIIRIENETGVKIFVDLEENKAAINAIGERWGLTEGHLYKFLTISDDRPSVIKAKKFDAIWEQLASTYNRYYFKTVFVSQITNAASFEGKKISGETLVDLLVQRDVSDKLRAAVFRLMEAIQHESHTVNPASLPMNGELLVLDGIFRRTGELTAGEKADPQRIRDLAQQAVLDLSALDAVVANGSVDDGEWFDFNGALDFLFNAADQYENVTVAPAAAAAPGGIDFDPSKLDLQIRRDGRGVPLPLLEQNLESINIKGLYPVIINILPINAQTLPLLSQLNVPPDVALAKS